ncbi:MAG: double-strand break repair helicase AddA [Rhodopseudomonas sp.]|nr:double-strand break repair helicase AddA [Rhodopseudomonas sp.]
MSAPRTIPPEASHVQIEAASPDTSAFVSANAGSGKTHVLAMRVINLLLRGVDPAKILCITFTKAASANMANRVFDTLANWTTLPDAELDRKIALSTGAPVGSGQRARARRLFASALETPGGLKVQTIHAFCTRLLHQFPFEANVAARFTVLDEAETTQLLDRLTLGVLLEASAQPASALGKALATAIVVAADTTFKDVIVDAIGKRDDIEGWIKRAGSVEAAIDELSHRVGIDPQDTADQAELDYFAKSLIPQKQWPALIDILANGLKTDQGKAAALASVERLTGRERIETYLDIFCTKEREPRKSLVTKGIATDYPAWLDTLQAEQARLLDLMARERAIAARDRTRALITIAAEVIARYRSEKDRRGLLDYNDLIDKTLDLFKLSSAAWVLYKLDLGIDHVLVDEAQDTSPQQWEIIKTIVSEFTPGGARPNVKRTMFAVGDEKQSIFSFQGAAPHAFDEMRQLFARQFDNEEQGWKFLRFHHSFRSGATVLGSVDRVFKSPEVYASVTTDAVGIPEHLALPGVAPGLVEIWDLIEPAERREMEGWQAPFDTESEQSPRVQLAARIAAQVGQWTQQGLRPGQVLVLVRQRGALFEAIIRALKTAGIPVAGADRLVLTEHIAVMDLMALADSLLLPDDDLSLASLLKSPLFGLDDDRLYRLAYDRAPLSLRAALRAKAADEPAFAAAADLLDDWTAAARRLTPFAFFAHVLGVGRPGDKSGRGKMLTRLGPEANDALDEFLNLALDYETRETPSLQGFVAWLRAAQTQVRRDMEMVRDEVRVMTVHGAKGLEANTVILADTTTAPEGPHDPRLFKLGQGEMVWATARANDAPATAEARDNIKTQARDEYRRLLYVAMTRAAERLVVCGSKGVNRIPSGCWYELIRNGLEDECVTEPAFDGNGTVLRYRKGDMPAATPSGKSGQESGKQTGEETGTPPSKSAPPVWLRQDAPRERPALRTVTPSATDEAAARPTASGGAGLALLRGSLVHRLMQSLPDLPVERRREAAADYLARAGVALEATDRATIADQVMRVIEDARFAELYGPASRAEVSIVGKVEQAGQAVLVSGRIDRLAVTDSAVLIGDFKTNRPPPRALADVPDAYVEQLALYRAVLRQLYPEKAVRAALIWTESIDFMDISGEALDAALARITSAR